MSTKRSIFALWLVGALLMSAYAVSASGMGKPRKTFTPIIISLKQTYTHTPTHTQPVTATRTPTVSSTPFSDPQPSATPAIVFTPHPDAPLCTHPNVNTFHALWNSALDCHYDHEHGAYPFDFIASTFPDFDYFTLLCGVDISHCNPSSIMENTHKHGGNKWQVTHNPNGCEAFGGFDFATLCVLDAAIQYHNFGDSALEFPARYHSAVSFLTICVTANDCGQAFLSQLIDFGECTSPYQTRVMPCVNNPPLYSPGLAPYPAIDCVGAGIGCRASRQFVLSGNYNVNTIWTSDPDHVDGSHLLVFLFRSRDAYQLYVDGSNPIEFSWLCSNDSGLTYTAMVGCRYNNSTAFVQEIGGTIPAVWDTLDGTQDGRVTYVGYITDYGDINTTCDVPGPDCHPIKLINVPVGIYGGHLIDDKTNQFSAVAQPERDIYFCNGVVCNETDAGAVPSGWIGAEN